MNEVDIRMRYSNPRSPAELAVSTPLGFETTAQIWSVLHDAHVTPSRSRLIRAGERLVLAASLTEHDGSRLSQERTGEVLEALRTALTRPVRAERESKSALRSAAGFARPDVCDVHDTDGCQACA